MANRRKGPDLGALLLNAVEDGLESGLAKTAVKPGFHIILEASTESFRAIIKGVPKWFVDGPKI